MKRDDADVESIGRQDFLDEDAATVQAKTLRSGRADLGRTKGDRQQLEPQIVSAPDGRLGWRVTLPGSRPLVTPAVVDGGVFIGGGFGSHEFYSFDVETGRLRWKIHTQDDGPTAATVAGRHVAFNTESCTVYVVDAASGRVLWEKWLGDPLMAQTAVSDGVLYMVYPDNQRVHRLVALDLFTGKRRFATELLTDVISAPIVSGDSVYAAALDGTVYRGDRESGKVCWSIHHRATSAPWIYNGRLYMSQREEIAGRDGPRSTEGYRTASLEKGQVRSQRSWSRRTADYLKFRAEAHAAHAEADAGVGFATAPGSAKLSSAKAHLGLGHVSSVWAFQGSRPEVFDDGIFTVLDDTAQRLEHGTRKPLWRARLQAEQGDDRLAGAATRALSPPALTEGRVYLTSALGDLFVLDRRTGEELWSVNVGAPILAQPAVADGKVVFGTRDGTLYAFQTDDSDAGGWPMWGGGAGHNG